MSLSDAQRDVLTELGNIGISRAARQLSSLLGVAIQFAVPRVELCPSREMARQLAVNREALACVVQRLSGDLDGQIALLLPARESRLLLQGLPVGTADQEREAFAELGNILISACVSAMADMLELRIELSVPSVIETGLRDFFFADEESAGLLIRAHMLAAERNLACEIVLHLSAAAADRVVFAVQALILAAD